MTNPLALRFMCVLRIAEEKMEAEFDIQSFLRISQLFGIAKERENIDMTAISKKSVLLSTFDIRRGKGFQEYADLMSNLLIRLLSNFGERRTEGNLRAILQVTSVMKNRHYIIKRLSPKCKNEWIKYMLFDPVASVDEKTFTLLL